MPRNNHMALTLRHIQELWKLPTNDPRGERLIRRMVSEYGKLSDFQKGCAYAYVVAGRIFKINGAAKPKERKRRENGYAPRTNIAHHAGSAVEKRKSCIRYDSIHRTNAVTGVFAAPSAVSPSSPA